MNIAANKLIPSSVAPRRWSLYDVFLACLCVVLAGYAFLGKGFAYLGVGGVYVGELTLALGAVALVRSAPWRALTRSSIFWLLAAFMAWCALRTTPCLAAYRYDALRDAATAGYGFIAVVTAAAVLDRRRRWGQLLRRYANFAPWFVLLIVPLLIVSVKFQDRMPTGINARHTLLYLKPGDVAALAAGACAMWLAAVMPWRWWISVPFVVVFLMASLLNRGGMLAFVVAVLVVALAVLGRKSYRRRMVVLAVAVIGVQAILSMANFEMTYLRHGTTQLTQPVSFRTVGVRMLGMLPAMAWPTGGGEAGGGPMPAVVEAPDYEQATLESTIAWRMSWWRAIVRDISTGDLWYCGRGFGVNLADQYGYQVTRDRSLRSPHNIHITILARAGYPGLTLWLALQGAWLALIGRAWWASVQRRQRWWRGVFAAMPAFWAAMMVIATFDVYLEGPVGALWFWTVFGLGWAAAQRYVRPNANVKRAAA